MENNSTEMIALYSAIMHFIFVNMKVFLIHIIKIKTATYLEKYAAVIKL